MHQGICSCSFNDKSQWLYKSILILHRYGKNEVEGKINFSEEQTLKSFRKEYSSCDKLTDSEEDEGVKVVKALLENKADINEKDEYNLTSLHHAALR